MDVQVVEAVTSSLLTDYSATSEGASSLRETGEQPVALKQRDTLQSESQRKGQDWLFQLRFH